MPGCRSPSRAAKGVWLWDDVGQALSRRARRHRRVRARSRPPAACQALAEQAGDAHPHLEPLSRHATGRARRRSSATCRAWTTCSSATPAAEANEAAIKLARLFGHQKGIDLPTIIVMEQASTAAPWPRCPPPAAARCRPASSRCSRASCACRTTISRRSSRWPRTTRTSWRCWSSRSRAKAASMCAGPGLPREACARSATRRAGCSCWTRCRAASAAPAAGSRSSTPASRPT